MATDAHFDPASQPECYDPRMTRAQAIARRTAGTLDENCVVVITDGPTIGTPGNTSPTEIELNPTSPTELGLAARVHQNFDNSAWVGVYDIDLGTNGSITRLTDSSNNTAVDADPDSPTVHTQFPWHLGTTVGGNWRDNYAEDAVLVSADTAIAPMTVTNSRFINTTMDFTGWVAGTIADTLVQGTGTHHIFNTSSWQRSNVIAATVNATTANITLTSSDVIEGANVNTTGTGTITLTNSEVNQGSLVANAGTGVMAVTGSTIINGSQLNNDAGSLKNFQISGGTVINNSRIRGQAGTVARTIAISQSVLRSRPVVGDSIVVRDDAGINLSTCDIIFSNQWDIDGNVVTALQWIDVEFIRGDVIHGPLANNLQFQSSRFVGCIIDATGAGTGTFTMSAFNVDAISSTFRNTSPNRSLVLGANLESVGSTVAIDAASPRGLTVDGNSKLFGSTVIQTGTVDHAGFAGVHDRVFNCDLNAATIEFATTAGGTNIHTVSRCLVRGGPEPVGFPDGRIRVDGNSERTFIEQCEVWGDLHLTDVPDGALASPTSMFNNFVGATCALNYTGGDAVAKQIRDNRIEGNSSRIDCVGLTGSAGAALGDVFSSRVANQSILTVSGARVVGFPVRNVTVENGSTLTIPANGSALQVALKNNADLDTGAFTHFDSEISGNFSKVATASNINKLCNKSFDDWV